jgi:hypothetical protein
MKEDKKFIYHPDPEINQMLWDLLDKIEDYSNKQTGEQAKDLTYLLYVSTIPETSMLISENGVDYQNGVDHTLGGEIDVALKFVLNKRKQFIFASLENKGKAKPPVYENEQ